MGSVITRSLKFPVSVQAFLCDNKQSCINRCETYKLEFSWHITRRPLIPLSRTRYRTSGVPGTNNSRYFQTYLTTSRKQHNTRTWLLWMNDSDCHCRPAWTLIDLSWLIPTHYITYNVTLCIEDGRGLTDSLGMIAFTSIKSLFWAFEYWFLLRTVIDGEDHCLGNNYAVTILSLL